MMKRVTAVIMALILAFTLFGCAKKAEAPSQTTAATTTEKPTQSFPSYNPLTGSEKFNKNAIGRRPVAIVVENQALARPQWNIGSSDLIVEGEVEGGITRMLWFYADYTKVPEEVGPTRSARPPYVLFSRFFDSFYIHWGGSHNKGDYIGGYTVIKYYKVNDFDGMKGGKLFGRNTSRTGGRANEHTGVVYGKQIPDAIKKAGYRTNIKYNKFSWLKFNDKKVNPGKKDANTVKCKFSSRTDTRKFTFNKKDGKYHTDDWKTDVAFQNVILLMDNTRYFTVPYKNATTTYVNYKYSGGKGYYISNGKRKTIKWEVKKDKLYLLDDEGNKISLNKGKSYIGLASKNHDGEVTFE